MDLNSFFERVETTLLAQFHEAGYIQHAGDKGENREELLQEFLRRHLPHRYGVVKGEIVTIDGKHSHAADLIIYDALHCPVLYSGKTAVLPIEGVYGIIEVKSRLSKHEFVDAAKKIQSFKEMAPRDLSVIRTREYMTVHRPSRPFGIVFGYGSDNNSLASLKDNWDELNREIYNVNYFANLVVVVNRGLIRFERADLSMGEKYLLLDTDEFVQIVQTAHKRHANGEAELDNIIIKLVIEEMSARTFGRFFVYLTTGAS